MATKTKSKKQVSKKKTAKKVIQKRAVKKIQAKKKVAKKKAVKKIVELKEFDSYLIHRTKDSVEFGCGNVKVTKADLRAAADFLESLGKENGFQAIIRLSEAARSRKTLQQVLAIPPDTLRAIAGN